MNSQQLMTEPAKHEPRAIGVHEPARKSGPSYIAGLLMSVLFMGSTLTTPLYLLYRQAFGFSEVTLTLVYAVYVVGNLAALFFLGRISDQLGRRKTSYAGIALAVIATLVFLLARSTAWLFFARMLSGFAIGVGAGTATAWIAELTPGGDKLRASVVATAANFIGIGAGPFVAGLLAAYAPAPLRLSWVIYLVLLGIVAWLVAPVKETVSEPVRTFGEISFQARLGVPSEIRKAFTPPAVTAFAIFALIGYYAALTPSLLSQDLHIKSPAAAGMVVAGMFLTAAGTVPATRNLRSRTAMLLGLALLLPSLGCLIGAELNTSLVLLIVGSAFGGIASALGYRGSLQLVNGMAPEGKRAEVISSYMIACYVGNSVPVIGVGVLSSIWGHQFANNIFTATIAVFGAIAFFTGWRYVPRESK